MKRSHVRSCKRAKQNFLCFVILRLINFNFVVRVLPPNGLTLKAEVIKGGKGNGQGKS